MPADPSDHGVSGVAGHDTRHADARVLLPRPFEPARVPKPVTMDFIPQSYAKLAPLL